MIKLFTCYFLSHQGSKLDMQKAIPDLYFICVKLNRHAKQFTQNRIYLFVNLRSYPPSLYLYIYIFCLLPLKKTPDRRLPVRWLSCFLNYLYMKRFDRRFILKQSQGVSHHSIHILISTRGRVISMSDSQSGGPGFESRSDHFLDLFLGTPEFKSSATLVNSQLVCLRPVGILNNVMFNLNYLFKLFARPH